MTFIIDYVTRNSGGSLERPQLVGFWIKYGGTIEYLALTPKKQNT